MSITFTSLTPEEYDIGIDVDERYRIYNEEVPIGYLAISRDCEDGIIIEWIELDKEYRGKGLLRITFKYIFEHFERDEVSFEANYFLEQMYTHIGATRLDDDDFREVISFRLLKEQL